MWISSEFHPALHFLNINITKLANELASNYIGRDLCVDGWMFIAKRDLNK